MIPGKASSAPKQMIRTIIQNPYFKTDDTRLLPLNMVTMLVDTDHYPAAPKQN
jgi:hypothetical protein